jgi:co-chaperonin GroES (HSP10)
MEEINLGMSEFDQFNPLHNGILYKDPVVSAKTDSGLYKPQEAIDKEEATLRDDRSIEVLKIGKDVQNVRVGDRVWHSRVTPFPIQLDGKPYMIVFENQLVGHLRKGGVYPEDLVDTTKIFSAFAP